MGLPFFSWNNRVDADGVAFSSGSQVSNFPVQNIANPVVQKVWRTSGATSSYIGVDFKEPVSFRLLALFGATLASTDTIRWRASNTDASLGDLLDTGTVTCDVVDGYGASVRVLGSEVTARYMVIDITASSRAPEGSFDVGRLWVAPLWQPSEVGIATGYSETWEDTSLITYAPESGVEHVDFRPSRRRVALALPYLTESDRKQVQEMDRLVGVSEQLVFSKDIDSEDIEQEIILGRIAQSTPIKYPEFNIRSKAFEIRQSL